MRLRSLRQPTRSPATPERLLTAIVGDLDGWVAELGARGLASDTIETVPGLFRKAAIADPDGNTITFAEDVGA